MKIGSQLYSLRNIAATPEDLAATLKAVHDIGYRYVQLSGICKCDPGFLRELLQENDLTAVVCHVTCKDLTERLEETLAYYKTAGCENIGIGAMPKSLRGTPEGTQAFLAGLEKAMQALTAQGKKLYFHNHAFDFIRFPDGTDNLTLLAKEPRISLLLDTYWIHMGGYDAPAYIRACAGKCDIVHFKDWELDGNTPRFAPVGRGNLDWPAIYAACEDIGVKYAFVEQDDVYGEDTPLGCAEESFRNMDKWGWM